MLEVMASCLTYYPVTFQRAARLPDATQALRADAGRRRRVGRPRRARLRHRPAVARRLRHGRPPRVDGGTEVLPRPHRARPDDRRLGRRAHGRRGDRSRVRVPHPERPDRRRRERGRRSTTSCERGAFVDNPRDGVRNPGPPYRLSSTVLPPRRPAPALGEHTADPIPSAAPPNVQRRGQAPNVSPCRSRACGCST